LQSIKKQQMPAFTVVSKTPHALRADLVAPNNVLILQVKGMNSGAGDGILQAGPLLSHSPLIFLATRLKPLSLDGRGVGKRVYAKRLIYWKDRNRTDPSSWRMDFLSILGC
jgi:hypothetical protein